MTKHHPSGDADNPDLAALERLADTAPHLLADIGFREDSAAGGPGLRVWRRGAVWVAVRAATEVRAGRTARLSTCLSTRL